MIEKQIGASQVAAVLIEPIQGEGGFIVPADGFLPALADWCRQNGVVFIADEVQTGFARTGAMIAAEFVDPATGAPDATLAAAVAKASIAEGVIVLTCGTYGNVIRFLPPLSIPDALVHEAFDVIGAALAAN